MTPKAKIPPIFLLIAVSAVQVVNEVADSVPATAQFATDGPGLAEKVKKTAAFMSQFHDMSQDPQEDFSLAQIAQYDGEDNRPIFIVIDEIVYNVTEFVQYHPAGPKIIKDHAGQDATSAVKVMNVNLFKPFLHYFKVGNVISSEKDNSTATQYIEKNSIDSRV